MNQNERNKVQLSLIAGSSSGILSTLILYPMDVIRTKMQTGGCGKGPINVLQHTIQHGGIRALYTGMALPLAAQAVYKGTVFFVNDVTQNFIRDLRAWRYRSNDIGIIDAIDATKAESLVKSSASIHLSLTDRFWSGFVGGAVNGALFVTPVELVRNQLIAQHSKLATTTTTPTSNGNISTNKTFGGSWDVIQQSFQKRGILSLWRGVGWTIARDGLGCGCFFYSIAYFQQILTPTGESPSFGVKIISGGFAGLAYWLAALPLDSMKTWVQSGELNAASISVKESLHNIYVQSGLIGIGKNLLRGWQVAYGKGIPSSALIVVSYSFVYDGLLKLT